jgi:hypothetical protein
MKREQDKKVGFDELGELFFFGKRYYQVEDD